MFDNARFMNPREETKEDGTRQNEMKGEETRRDGETEDVIIRAKVREIVKEYGIVSGFSILQS
jgi:hypothetical protein